MTNELKPAILVSAIALLGISTAGFQDGAHYSDMVIFICGVSLLFIYHYFFDIDMNRIISVLKTENTGLCNRIDHLNNDIVSFKEQINFLNEEIACLRTQVIGLNEIIEEWKVQLPKENPKLQKGGKKK